MFRDFKDLWVVTRRVKTESIVEKETFLPMKCHPELTALLERYLLIVRPVEAEMINIVEGESQYHVYKEYIWTKRGRRVTPEYMRKSILDFNTDYCGMAAGIKIYRQIGVQMVKTFLGSEFEIKQEEMDVLATSAGHSITMARLRYASEVGKLPSMSSDLLLRFGRGSEAWWEHSGFKPGCPPLLPLRARQELREAALTAQLRPAPAPVIDTQAIILAVTSVIVAKFNTMQVNLDAQIQASVADALFKAQHPNAEQPHLAPPHLSSSPPSSRLRPRPPARSSRDIDMGDDDDEEEASSPTGSPPPPPTDIYGDVLDPAET